MTWRHQKWNGNERSLLVPTRRSTFATSWRRQRRAARRGHRPPSQQEVAAVHAGMVGRTRAKVNRRDAARRATRQRSIMETIAADSPSIDASGSVAVARAPRRGPASRSSELAGVRWPTAGRSAEAAMESGPSRLVAPQAACRGPSRSVFGPRLERGAGGRSRDDDPERGDGAERHQERVERPGDTQINAVTAPPLVACSVLLRSPVAGILVAEEWVMATKHRTAPRRQ
jgi:hypothetical protein